MDEFVALVVRMTPPSSGAEIYSLSALCVASGILGTRYASMVRTREPLPYQVRIVAGIEPALADDIPNPDEVAVHLRRFAGERPIVVDGDQGASNAISALLGAPELPLFDVGELADLFEPLWQYQAAGNGRQRTESLAKETGSSLPSEDRVAERFVRFEEAARRLDPLVLQEICQRTAVTSWPLRSFFARMAASAGVAAHAELSRDRDAGVGLPEAASGRSRNSISSSPSRRANRSESIVASLESAIAGPAGYEYRQQQVEMAGAVESALVNSHHLVVEAGTGTGKSLAYLFPAACLALRDNGRVVVSTNTINLQEQLLTKDIPAVRDLLVSHAPEDIRGRAAELETAVLKGRRNYLCLQRLATLRRTPTLTDLEVRFLTRMLLWLSAGGGDRSSLHLPADEEFLWDRMSAEGTDCFASGNYFVRNGYCQLAQARRRGEAAHLVVVNHALLLSDIGMERHIIPTYERLIIDEAHNLEDQATERFGFRATEGEIASLLDAVVLRSRDRETGIVAEVRTATRGRSAAAEEAILGALLVELTSRTERARQRLPEAFGVVRGFVRQHGQSEGGYDQRLSVTRATRAQPEWSQVELAWENLSLALMQVRECLEQLALIIAARDEHSVLEKESVLALIASRQLAISTCREGVAETLERHNDGRIAWITLSSGGTVGVSSAPLDVGEMLDTYLFATKASVVLTSATLTTGGSFDYVRERLGLEEAEELQLGSPFDYERAAMLLLPTDIVEPSDPRYQHQVEDAVVELCAASRGRALVLFTSHSALRATHRAVRPRLAALGIRTLAQGVDGSPPELIAALRLSPQTVICGTSSFWEGVDVVGEALSLLIIAKLPFSVPSDPVFAARAELFEDPFRQYALPQAILRFKQGFGRLIRQRGDRGVVAVLDRRLRSKGYGRLFLRSLPTCSLRESRLENAGTEVERWLADLPSRESR